VQIKSFTFTASTKRLRAKLLYKKGARKMLLKLTPDRRKEDREKTVELKQKKYNE
jgi:hypothetical protein